MGYTEFKNGEQPALNDTNLNNMQLELMKLVFPIGSTYVTQTNTNPNTLLKFGTWERLNGKVLVGLDEEDENFNEIGKTGGEKTHTLNTTEMPKHGHSSAVINPNTSGSTVEDYGYKYTSSQNGVAIALESCVSKDTKGWLSTTIEQEIGGNQAHNNLQPYKVVGYMWLRTA